MAERPNSTPAPIGPSIPFAHQSDLRALPKFTNIPSDHMTVAVEGHWFKPHLLNGEMAVVDLSDTEPVVGEFFVIAYGSATSASGCVLNLCIPRGEIIPFNLSRNQWERSPYYPGDVYEDRMKWDVAHQYLPKRLDPFSKEYDFMLRTGQLRCGEGPFTTEHLRSKLLGRVVGYYHPRNRYMTESRING